MGALDKAFPPQHLPHNARLQEASPRAIPPGVCALLRLPYARDRSEIVRQMNGAAGAAPNPWRPVLSKPTSAQPRTTRRRLRTETATELRAANLGAFSLLERYRSPRRRSPICLAALTIDPLPSPARPPTNVAGIPISSIAKRAVGGCTMSPTTNPTIAPIAPSAAAPTPAHRKGSGEGCAPVPLCQLPAAGWRSRAFMTARPAWSRLRQQGA